MEKEVMQKKLEALGLKVWGSHLEKPRIYINWKDFHACFGLEIYRYGTGNIKSAYLNNEKISNTQAGKLLGGGQDVYFDCKTGDFVGTTLDCIL